MSPVQYIGDELELFALAQNWKSYLSHSIRPYLGARVLEVGAGLGATTAALCKRQHQRWVCLEPDRKMARELDQLVLRGRLPEFCEAVEGTLSTADVGGPFDTALYVDVLEHIADDASELAQIPDLLTEGGTLVVVVPAHQWLSSPFDDRIGHFRRYSRRRLSKAVPPGLVRMTLRYLDSAGLLASLGNRVLLRQSLPSRRQIAVWDQYLVPISRRLDTLLGGNVGKSVLGVWRRALQSI